MHTVGRANASGMLCLAIACPTMLQHLCGVGLSDEIYARKLPRVWPCSVASRGLPQTRSPYRWASRPSTAKQ
eukprot:5712212-Amphidinium_carterae.1